VWLRRWLHPEGAQAKKASSVNDRLMFELDAKLSARLRAAARTRGQPPETLATVLLSRGLKQEALRAQAVAALTALTPREQEVAWLTARGHTNHQIAEALVVSPETVKTHVRHVLEKFNVRSKADLRLLLLDLGVRWWEG
jgi:DNA-binding NarL/FixJ family response regulator